MYSLQVIEIEKWVTESFSIVYHLSNSIIFYVFICHCSYLPVIATKDNTISMGTSNTIYICPWIYKCKKETRYINMFINYYIYFYEIPSCKLQNLNVYSKLYFKRV